MKTVKKGFSRGLSVLLTLVMVLSLTVVGMVSSSAAQVNLADTGWSKDDTYYYWGSNPSGNDRVQMTYDETENCFKFTLSNLSTTNGYNVWMKPYGISNGKTTYFSTPNEGQNVSLTNSDGSLKFGEEFTLNYKEYNSEKAQWQFDAKNYKTNNVSNIDVIFRIRLNGTTPVLTLQVVEAGTSGGGSGGGETTTDRKSVV